MQQKHTIDFHFTQISKCILGIVCRIDISFFPFVVVYDVTSGQCAENVHNIRKIVDCVIISVITSDSGRYIGCVRDVEVEPKGHSSMRVVFICTTLFKVVIKDVHRNISTFIITVFTGDM